MIEGAAWAETAIGPTDSIVPQSQIQVNVAQIEHEHSRDWVDVAALAISLLTIGLLICQGFILWMTVLDGRLSRLCLVVEGSNWLKEIKGANGKSRFEITAQIQNPTSKACILEWFAFDICRFEQRNSKFPRGGNEAYYLTRVVESGKTLVFTTTSSQEFSAADIAAVKADFADELDKTMSGKKSEHGPFSHLWFSGTVAYRTLFNEQYWLHSFGYVKWKKDGAYRFDSSIDKFNKTIKITTLRHRLFLYTIRTQRGRDLFKYKVVRKLLTSSDNSSV